MSRKRAGTIKGRVKPAIEIAMGGKPITTPKKPIKKPPTVHIKKKMIIAASKSFV